MSRETESLFAARHDVRAEYGPWEARRDLPLVRKQHRGYNGLVFERLAHVIDRRVSTTWRDANGNLCGRWDWESGL